MHAGARRFVHSAYASASHTPAAVTAATSPTAMPRMVSASADKASTSAREGRAAAVQHRQASMSEPEDEDPDDWNALGSSGRRYRSPSMLQVCVCMHSVSVLISVPVVVVVVVVKLVRLCVRLHVCVGR